MAVATRETKNTKVASEEDVGGIWSEKFISFCILWILIVFMMHVIYFWDKKIFIKR